MSILQLEVGDIWTFESPVSPKMTMLIEKEYTPTFFKGDIIERDYLVYEFETCDYETVVVTESNQSFWRKLG